MTKAKRASNPPASVPAHPAPAPARPSSLIDTRVMYCGDNHEQLAKLPDGCVDHNPQNEIAWKPNFSAQPFFITEFV